MARWSLKQKRRYRQALRDIKARQTARERSLDRRAYYLWKRPCRRHNPGLNLRDRHVVCNWPNTFRRQHQEVAPDTRKRGNTVLKGTTLHRKGAE